MSAAKQAPILTGLLPPPVRPAGFIIGLFFLALQGEASYAAASTAIAPAVGATIAEHFL